jgi:hypothetical protein
MLMLYYTSAAGLHCTVQHIVQVFQREGKAIAAQWSAASGAWVEIGEVLLQCCIFYLPVYTMIFNTLMQLTSLNLCECVIAQARTVACYACKHITTVVCAMSSSIAEPQLLVNKFIAATA